MNDNRNQGSYCFDFQKLVLIFVARVTLHGYECAEGSAKRVSNNVSALQGLARNKTMPMKNFILIREIEKFLVLSKMQRIDGGTNGLL